MKKWLVYVTLSVGVVSNMALADALKNSLSNIMKTDDSVPMVDLSSINLDAKPKPAKKVIKNRSPKTVVGTVNGHKIIKKDADNYLKQRTKGRVSNYDALPLKQRKMLLQEIGLPYLAYDMAQKELTDLEKESVLNRAWMQKEARNIDIKDIDIKRVYNQMKMQAIDANSTRPIPPYESIKERLRMQMIEKKIMSKLMQGVQIEVEGS